MLWNVKMIPHLVDSPSCLEPRPDQTLILRSQLLAPAGSDETGRTCPPGLHITQQSRAPSIQSVFTAHLHCPLNCHCLYLTYVCDLSTIYPWSRCLWSLLYPLYTGWCRADPPPKTEPCLMRQSRPRWPGQSWAGVGGQCLDQPPLPGHQPVSGVSTERATHTKHSFRASLPPWPLTIQSYLPQLLRGDTSINVIVELRSEI